MYTSTQQSRRLYQNIEHAEGTKSQWKVRKVDKSKTTYSPVPKCIFLYSRQLSYAKWLSAGPLAKYRRKRNVGRSKTKGMLVVVLERLETAFLRMKRCSQRSCFVPKKCLVSMKWKNFFFFLRRQGEFFVSEDEIALSRPSNKLKVRTRSKSKRRDYCNRLSTLTRT